MEDPPKEPVTVEVALQPVAVKAIIRVGWTFSSVLLFPWRPVLAAAGETAHYLAETDGRIVRYEESWKSKPWDVVKRLVVPSKK